MATFAHRLNWIRPLWLAAMGICLTSSVISAGDPYAPYDLEMMSRPKLPVSGTEIAFPEGLIPRWLKALDRPDAQLRRLTIDTIGIAHRRGVPGIESTKPRLLELLKQPNQDFDVIKSIVQVLVKFDAKEVAGELMTLCEAEGDSVRRVVEPVLVNWKTKSMEPTWLSRLRHPSASSQLLLTAIEGLGAISSQDASGDLAKLIKTTSAPIPIRMESSRSLGKIGSADALNLAKELSVSDGSPLNAIMAINLLSQNDSQQAIDILTDLLRHRSSAVQAESLERLFQIDVSLVDAKADQLIGSKDSNVRRWCLRAMLAKPLNKRIKAIAPLLNDVNPSIRREATAGLLEWAKQAKLKDTVIEQAAMVLQRDSWQGCEQAIVVLASLDHDDSGGRFVELLKHDRAEVKVASAWGLVQLRNKEMLPAMLERANAIQKGFQSGRMTASNSAITLQAAHLFIAFGDQMYEPAEEILRAFVPKNLLWGTESRGAACWSLGLLKAKDPPQDLITQMTERIRDTESLEPEDTFVRRMCAIAFGHMKAESTLGVLREYDDVNDSIGQACFWSIEQMTGEVPPKPQNTTRRIDAWFLGPLRDESFSQ